MKPLVSVIIPVFNRCVLITKALKSIQNQTFTNWEAIVVDDGSADNTAEVVEELMCKDSRIQLIRHEKNKGAQAARNTGIHAANGEWIAFLDSDDQWLPYSLEVRLNLAAKENAKIVHSECLVIRQDSSMLESFGIPSFSGWIYKKLLKVPGPMFQSLLVTKDALENINYLDERIIAYQEWDTAIRLAKYYRFCFVSEPTFIYNCLGVDMISKNMLRSVLGYQQVIHKHFFAILLNVGPYILAQHYRSTIFKYLVTGKHKIIVCILPLLFMCPFQLRSILKKFKQL